MAGRPDSFMPLYIGDYLADTGHLTAAEHGAYLLLLMHYWRTGKPLPSDDEVLARIAKMPGEEWEDAKITVRGFFIATVTDAVTVLKHKRAEEELNAARLKYESRKAASDKANAAKNAAKEQTSNRDGNRNEHRDGNRGMTEPQPQPHSSNEESSLRSDSPAKAGVRRKMPEDWPAQADQEKAIAYWRKAGREDLVENLQAQISLARAHHLGKGTRSPDWPQIWITWYTRALEYNKPAKAAVSPFPTAKILSITGIS